MYLKAKIDETIVHEWIDFPDLESIVDEKDKSNSLNVRIKLSRI